MEEKDFKPRLHNGVIEFPVHHMRGGTSVGLVLDKRNVPESETLQEELLRHLMGVPLTGEQIGNKQVTGLGRGTPVTNKVFIVENDMPQRRLVSTLAQLAASKSTIDWSVNCGNMSSALPLFALDMGWLPASGELVEMEIYNTNTQTRMQARMHLSQGQLISDTQIPGVAGCFPGVDLFLNKPMGAKTGKLFPTGNVSDRFGDIEATCIDVAVPMVIARATDFGKSGYESPEQLDGDVAFKQALRSLWVEAGQRMQLRNPKGKPMTCSELENSETIPKICIISPARESGDISTRYFTPQNAHPSLAVSGGCCLASACLIAGTTAYEMSKQGIVLCDTVAEFRVAIENPAGILDTIIQAGETSSGAQIEAAAYRRSAQILLRGRMPLYRASEALKADLAARVA